ncbi:MAG: FtsW/RodA/SpoVE family cell cycle protein, partial [bacterium]
SSAAISFLLAVILLLLSGFPMRRLSISVAIIITLMIISILLTPYQRDRFLGHFTGGEIANNTVYQKKQSILAFARGGYLGVGLGQGQQKMGFLPEPHTDSILATIGEESGLIGVTFLFLLYLFFALRAANGLLRVGDEYLSLVGWGLLISIIIQFLLHVTINVGLLPHTGDPMPFLSYGGSSLLVHTWGGTLLWRIVHEESS